MAGGLTEAEASRRQAERGPQASPGTSRSYASIVRANVFTVFNLILAVAGGMTLAFGEWQDALFLGVLVANAGIGTAQEVRAKRALDRLSALVAPQATVVRDGTARQVARRGAGARRSRPARPGDQVVADGVLEDERSLRLDESILTGESTPCRTAGRRGGALRLVRGRRHRGLHGHRCRRGQLRRADSRARRARSGIPARRSSVR